MHAGKQIERGEAWQGGVGPDSGSVEVNKVTNFPVSTMTPKSESCFARASTRDSLPSCHNTVPLPAIGPMSGSGLGVNAEISASVDSVADAVSFILSNGYKLSMWPFATAVDRPFSRATILSSRYKP